MFFLQPIFEWVEAIFGETINHFYLIELIFHSLDRTLFYFIYWLIARFLYLVIIKKSWRAIPLRREFFLHVFVFYSILLTHLTVFRGENTLFNVTFHRRPFSDINLTPFVHTFKLTNGLSMFSYYYNLYGNILWFVPMGFGASYLMRGRGHYFKAFLLGASVSFAIETLQFLFYTGITDIDDLIFNTLGTIIGIAFYRGSNYIKRKWCGEKLD